MEKKLKDAIDYIMNNPTLSFHHVAIKFEVNVIFIGFQENLDGKLNVWAYKYLACILPISKLGRSTDFIKCGGIIDPVAWYSPILPDGVVWLPKVMTHLCCCFGNRLDGSFQKLILYPL